ncbi:MAG: hypothetical protein ACRDHZ_17020, partial [Ktedonobacteraceae bacterium]
MIFINRVSICVVLLATALDFTHAAKSSEDPTVAIVTEPYQEVEETVRDKTSAVTDIRVAIHYRIATWLPVSDKQPTPEIISHGSISLQTEEQQAADVAPHTFMPGPAVGTFFIIERVPNKGSVPAFIRGSAKSIADTDYRVSTPYYTYGDLSDVVGNEVKGFGVVGALRGMETEQGKFDLLQKYFRAGNKLRSVLLLQEIIRIYK